MHCLEETGPWPNPKSYTCFNLETDSRIKYIIHFQPLSFVYTNIG